MIIVRRIVLGLLAGLLLVVVGAAAADAHPLGNFTVNHYDGLVIRPDRVENLAVVDTAEIPALQERRLVDENGDDQVNGAERRRYAGRACATLASEVTVRAGSRPLRWQVISSRFEYRSGAAGLDVSRLECRLSAKAEFNRSTTLTFADGYQAERIGWHEITAVGRGVHLERSPVPARSISDELRAYPDDLLSSPLDVRSVELSVLPGTGLSTSADVQALPVAGPIARRLNVLSGHFNDLVGARTLTPSIGLLAVLLSLVLGASHALMPGHGKTVIAAYLAGRRGSVADALTVGATVTVTHTAGVIVLGLLLSAVAALAGETVLAWLGVASGLLIAVIGGWLLATAVGRRPGGSGSPATGPGPAASPSIVLPPDARDERVTPGVREAPDARVAPGPKRVSPSVARAGRLGTIPHVGIEVSVERADHEPDRSALPSIAAQQIEQIEHDHEPDHSDGQGHGLGHGREDGHGHGHGWSFRASQNGDAEPLGRFTLVGMGIAGGLVPSPSALVVLLGAIGLGRTWFGILLVIGYGIGMAATLTAVGLLLVRLRARLDDATVLRFSTGGHRLAAITPVLTATLVLLVGVGLAVRAVVPLLP